LSIAGTGFMRFGEIAALASLVLILVGCVVLHVRLRNRASRSLLVSLAAAALWFSAGQSMVYKLLAPPYVPSPPTEGLGNNAQAALDAMGDDAPARNAVVAGDVLLPLWIALSLVFAVVSIPSRANKPTRLEDGPPR
jgi:beta-lactamase regulating signal transducer with metallopeptidase domain